MTADDLPARILSHLSRYPDLSANEITGALKVTTGSGAPAVGRVRGALTRLERDGRAVSSVTPKPSTGRWAVTRWRTTQDEMAATAAREGMKRD